MKKTLPDVIFASEKRKGVLLLLKDGAKEMEFLLRSLNTTRQALLPQIRILEEHHLVTHQRDTYELTIIGKLLVDEITPFLNTVGVLEIDIDYWGSHKLDFIPPQLIKKFNAIGKCTVINPDLTDMYDVHKGFRDNSKIPRNIYIVTEFLYPNYKETFSEQISNSVNVYLIVSKELLNKILADHRSEFTKFIESKSFHFFVYNGKIGLMGFTYDDYHMLISLLTSSGEFDGRHVLCSNPGAIEWGNELFKYYLKDSTPVTEL
jgi:predicted transcriptional regulator